MKLPVLLLISTILFTPISAQCQNERAKNTNRLISSIPFKLGTDNRIYIDCRVNDSDTLTFLLDTGASDMVINPSSSRTSFSMTFDSEIQNLGSTGSNTVRASSSNRVCFGTEQVDNIRFIAIEYPNERWDGVFGLSILKNYVVMIDYEHMKIHLFDPETFEYTESPGADIEFRYNVPAIYVMLHLANADHRLLMEIDTGSDRIIDIANPIVENLDLLSIYQPFSISTVVSSDGNSGQIYNVLIESIICDQVKVTNLPAGLSCLKFGILSSDELNGMMGNAFLKRFNLTLDFKRNKAYFVPNHNSNEPF